MHQTQPVAAVAQPQRPKALKAGKHQVSSLVNSSTQVSLQPNLLKRTYECLWVWIGKITRPALPHFAVGSQEHEAPKCKLQREGLNAKLPDSLERWLLPCS